MKKLLFTLTAIAGFTFASNAQDFGFKKTDFIVEGNFQATSINERNSDTKVSEFNFTPKVGYFVSDKFAVGLEFGIGQEKQTTNPSVGETIARNNTFGVGAFGRYYFLELGSRFKTYTELGAGYLNSRSKTEIAGTTTEDPKVNGFGANLGIGANYFLTDKIAINFAFTDVLSYGSAKADVDGAKSSSVFNANVNQFNNFFSNATFGLTFKF